MDRFADGMIARGPTLGADRATWTGSVHIVDLPGVEAAGVVLALQASTRQAVDALLGVGRLDDHLGVQILDWEFGGRR